MVLTERVKNILLQPEREWQAIVAEKSTVEELYKSYAAPLAAIGPVASIIGMSIVGMGWGYRVSLISSIIYAIVNYALTLGGIYLLGLIIDYLAGFFSGERNLMQALKVAVYSSTAALLAGAFALIPALSFLGLVGLYSVYLLYLGLPVLMKVDPGKSLNYTVSVTIAAAVLFAMIGGVSNAFIR